MTERSTTHAWTTYIGDRVGIPDDFHPEACATLCEVLDARPSDGGVGADLALDPYLGGDRFTTCRFAAGGELVCDYNLRYECVGGRAPAGLLASRARRRTVGAFFAETEHLERASVPAFEELAVELARQGAPSQFVRAARASAMDERVHARAIGRLRARAGGESLPIERRAVGERDLPAMALDNAVEGCVRETHGALAAALQAETASDPLVRATYARIARDEARHALLSFALHDWMSPRLAPRVRRDIEDRRRDAVACFESAASVEPLPALRVVAGLPDATASCDVLALLA